MQQSSASTHSLVAVDAELGRFRVHRDAFRSAEVFADEMKLVFGKCWLYLGHISEVPSRGSFQRRTVGGRDLIFLRSRDDQILAFYNSCTHRGARLCREKRGVTKNFSCPYHGWVFATDGRLMSMNSEPGGFARGIADDPSLNLRRVERLEQYRGFFFVNYDPNAIGLTDYLAGAKGFLDLMIDQAEGRELIVLPGEHSYAVAANYKFMCENSYDGYHVPSTHMSYLEYLQERDLTAGKSGEMANLLKKYSTEGSGWGLGHGHGGMESWVPTGRPVAQWVPSWGLELKQQIENTYQRLVERYGAKRAERIAQLQKNMVIFPNLVINDNVGFTVRTIEPTSVSSMRIHAWALAPAGESSDIKKIRLENFVGFLGPAGMGSSDDVEMMEICQRGLEHTPLEWNELSKGMRSDADRRWEESGPNDEAQIRAYWAQWDLLMRGEMAFDQPECPRKVEVA